MAMVGVSLLWWLSWGAGEAAVLSQSSVSDTASK